MGELISEVITVTAGCCKQLSRLSNVRIQVVNILSYSYIIRVIILFNNEETKRKVSTITNYNFIHYEQYNIDYKNI